MLRFLDPANVVTLAALLAAAACVALAIERLPAYAAVALIVSGLCDLLDGFVARRLKRTDEQRRFGAQLDSLVDVCAFGFAPVVLLYTSGLNHAIELPLLGLFLVCAVWRLAYFEAVGLESEAKARYYIGLPTTYVALVLPLVYLTALAGSDWFGNCARLATALLAGAMVCTLRFRKPGGLAYAGFLVLAIVVAGVLIAKAPLLHAALRT